MVSVDERPRAGKAAAVEGRIAHLDERRRVGGRVARGGPYEVGDPRAPAPERLTDFGSLLVPVPPGVHAEVQRRPNQRTSGVHIQLPAGEVRLHVLAAPRSGSLWEQVAREIFAGGPKRTGQVHSERGRWGREVVTVTEDTVCRYVGVDGPRWLVYGVATGPFARCRELAQALRTIMQDTVVVRGTEPYPVKSGLPLSAGGQSGAPRLEPTPEAAPGAPWQGAVATIPNRKVKLRRSRTPAKAGTAAAAQPPRPVWTPPEEIGAGTVALPATPAATVPVPSLGAPAMDAPAVATVPVRAVAARHAAGQAGRESSNRSSAATKGREPATRYPSARGTSVRGLAEQGPTGRGVAGQELSSSGGGRPGEPQRSIGRDRWAQSRPTAHSAPCTRAPRHRAATPPPLGTPPEADEIGRLHRPGRHGEPSSHGEPSGHRQPNRHGEPSRHREPGRGDEFGRGDGPGPRGEPSTDNAASERAELRLARQRLAVLESVLTALNRYQEIIPLVAGAANHRAALDAVRDYLQVDEMSAHAILSLPWHRLTRERRRALTIKRDEIRRYLHAHDPSFFEWPAN